MYQQNNSILGKYGGKYMYAAVYTGFAHFFRQKIQGLFKDFQGPNFEISRTSFLFKSMNLPIEMVWQYNSSSFFVTYMRENNVCLYDMTWVADYFHWSFQRLKMRVRKKFKDFQGPGMKSRDFQGFSRPWKCTLKIQGFSRLFKTHTNPVYIYVVQLKVGKCHISLLVHSQQWQNFPFP